MLKDIKPTKEYETHSEIWDYINERDNSRCGVCGRGDRTEQHHIDFKSKGGKNIPNNIVTLCFECHNKQHGWKRESIEYLKSGVISRDKKFRERLV